MNKNAGFHVCFTNMIQTHLVSVNNFIVGKCIIFFHSNPQPKSRNRQLESFTDSHLRSVDGPENCDTSTIQDVPVRKILILAALHPHFKVQPAFQVPTIQGTLILQNRWEPKA